MKKYIIVLIFSLFLLIGCNQKSEEPNLINRNNTIKTQSEYLDMVVIELNEDILIIGPPADDPEASYPSYEVNINENTKVEGRITDINLIENGDYVSVWTEPTQTDKLIAEVIQVD
ncbi:hypothetical protein [Gracilibacillus xinjiangensis]|uniref:DUF3221 domain-containing protein n=1 Tax=Gracilibacillus xinjiangensis TaxID=1193282 RepID=A0ABV8WWH9_9BACI